MILGKLKSSSSISRHPNNPILSASEVPYNSALVFNAGVVKYHGKYVMVFRNDYGSIEKKRIDGTNLGLAFSDDGIKWEVEPEPCFHYEDQDVWCVNDPRLTVIDEKCCMTFAMIARSGVRGAIAITEDFHHFEVLHETLPDNRNLVLFPEKIDQKYLRLERPFANYLRAHQESFDIWLSESPDLIHWGNPRLVLSAAEVPFSNDKIGPGTPPIKTEKGWITIFHSVDVDPNRGKQGWEEKWDKRYTAGVMLLDLEEPSKIIGFSKEPILVPEVVYETENGFRNNVVFPCAAILEENGEFKIYYGAADTVECLAFINVEDLIKACLE
jgi:beta-1,4-mannooligosaccharide/beta-1,4-mannosyl-N-acetylglucosamine phosphorylase